jgi:RHS repeat-associated protein
LVPNRHGSTPAYRYGFQGQEKDDELKGEGNSYDFGARMLDPRVGRWFAPDKMEGNYPSSSTYAYTLNNPIYYIDPDGNEPYDWYKDKNGNFIYDKYVFSQQSLISAGIEGTYLEDASIHHFRNGVGINTFQLNNDGTVWDNNRAYMDNFGEINIGTTGVKIINEYTFSEKWDDYVSSNLFRASAAVRRTEGQNLFKSGNTGFKASFKADRINYEFEAGLYSSGEHTFGFYFQRKEEFVFQKLDNKGLNKYDLGSIKFSGFAKLSTYNSFNNPSVKNDIKTKFSLTLAHKGIGATVEHEKSLISGKEKKSVGFEFGTSTKSKVEGNVSFSRTYLSKTDEFNVE